MAIRRTRLAAAAVLVVAPATAASLASQTDRAAAQLDGCAILPPGNSKTFKVVGKGNTGQPFLVPENVTQLYVTAEGGHGGQYSDTYVGGPGGGVDAVIQVTPGECLKVFVGGYGYHGGGVGWAKGGDHGTIAGGPEASGDSAAGGGGASAIVRGSQPLVVAGGGGGGGGNGADLDGGAGGAGGNPPENGSKRFVINGSGGKGGGSKHDDGDSGSSSGDRLADYGAGGGGGGGIRGGKGGDTGQYDANSDQGSGGGGGGGGRSLVLTPVPLNSRTLYFQSTRPCHYKKKFISTCHGQVTLAWQQNSTDLIFPLNPVIRIPWMNLKPARRNGVPVSLSPVAAPEGVRVLLKLFHKRKGKWRLVRKLSVTASGFEHTRLRIKLPGKIRKRLKGRHLAGFRLVTIDEATGRRISRQRLTLD